MGRAPSFAFVLMCFVPGCPGGTESAREPTPAEERAPTPAKGPESAPRTGQDASPPTSPTGPLLGRRALGTDAATKSARLNVGGFRQIQRGRASKARELLEEALAADPDNATAAYNLACVHAREKTDDRAAELLIAALRGNLPRFGPRMEGDPDLLRLRRGPAWPRVTKERDTLRAAWATALGEPGAVLLIGAKRTVSPDMPSPDGDYSRGRLYFFHATSGRVLPLTSRPSAAGFVVNVATKSVHAIEWRAIEVANDVDPMTYQEVAVTSVDLTTLESSTAHLGARATTASVHVHEGKAYGEATRYHPAEAREEHVSFEVHVGGSKRAERPRPAPPAAAGALAPRARRADVLGSASPEEVTGEGAERCLALTSGRLCQRALEGSPSFFDLLYRPADGPERSVGTKLPIIQIGRGVAGP